MCEACTRLVGMGEAVNGRGGSIRDMYFESDAGVEELQKWPNYKADVRRGQDAGKTRRIWHA